MSAYLLLLLTEIWDWVFGPPLHWALSLSLEWKLELAGLLIVGLFCRSIIEHYVIGGEVVGEWWKERGRINEWYYYGGMDEREFRAHPASMRRAADKQDRLAERLEDRAGQGFRGRILRQAAIRRQTQAQHFRDEADRVERLWQAIEKERGGPGDKAGMRKKVLGLMQKLDGRFHADKALAELNRIGNWFDWGTLAPADMPRPQRERLVQLLRLMAGTTSLGEARNAYSGALRMLQQNNWEWEWEIA
jgi:hypothetical protein